MKLDQVTKKIAIFGGSFDPPHFGHADIVKNLEAKFDGVVVVPAYVSPFKAGADNAKLRLSLCKKLFSSAKTTVSNIELRRGGVSYSVDTAKALAKKYRGAELYWVIGSEETKKLADWHDIDTLKTLVTFYVVPRPGYPVDPAVAKALKKRGLRLKTAPFEGPDISSTDIKIDVAFGKPNCYVPYIVHKQMTTGEFDSYSKYVEALYRYGLTQKRIDHSYGVAKRAAQLAKRFGCSVRDAVIAGILHDVAKAVDIADYKDVADIQSMPEPTVHAAIGAYIAKRDFNVSEEIAHAIFAHSTADERMSLLDEAVYLADKTEFNRNYKEVYYFRYLCDADKDFAMLTALKEVSEFREYTPCELSQKAIKLYEGRTAGRTAPQMLPLVPPQRTALPAMGEVKSRAMKLVPSAGKDITPMGDKSLCVSPKKSAALKALTTFTALNSTEERIARTVAAELSLHKGRDVDIIDLAGKTIIADYFVIASASSTTAVKALMGYVEDRLTKDFGIDPTKRDVDSEWIALDYGSVIVHIFTDRTREFYNIERLWTDGTNVTRIAD